MDVILDTNIFCQDFSLRSHKFQALFAYLRRTESTLIIPEIVVAEVHGVFRRRAVDLAQELRECESVLRSLDVADTLVRSNSLPAPDALLENFKRHLQQPNGQLRPRVVPVEEADLREALARELDRRKPASSDGRGLRDVLVWLAALKESRRTLQVAFISENVRDFSAPGQPDVLHPDLLQEASGRVSYFRRLDNFLRTHAARIDELDASWVARHIPAKTVGQILARELEGPGKLQDSLRAQYDDPELEVLRVPNVDLQVTDFFVADDDDVLYVSVTYSALADIEVEKISARRWSVDPEGPRFTDVVTIQKEISALAWVDVMGSAVSEPELESWELL